jgi:hypothetical protein
MAGRLIHMPMTNTPANHAIHRTAGPGTPLALERVCPRRVPAGPGSRRDHPPVMASVRPFGGRLRDSLGPNLGVSA